jgi:ubiquitin carboxyl-terminal hydrolase 10
LLARRLFSKRCAWLVVPFMGYADSRFRIIFLREFIPTTGYPSAAPSVSGTSTPRSEQSLPNGASTPRGPKRDPRREAFVPENVYDAMKENKRFDSMRVSRPGVLVKAGKPGSAPADLF